MPPKTANLGLILKRRSGEIILLELPEHLGGETIQLSVIEIDRNIVSVAIKCPREINIVRGEMKGLVLSHYRDITD